MRKRAGFMKIIVVGGSGTIGSPVVAELRKRHQVVVVGKNSGDFRVDITDEASILKMYKEVGEFDAVVSAAGSAHFGDFRSAGHEDLMLGVKSKLMGQINLVRIGSRLINHGGSFTLTSGVLGDDPVRTGVNSSFVNGGLNAFVGAAALEMDRGIRVNVVSPGLVEESSAELGYLFPGHVPVKMKRVVPAYVKSVEGARSGEVIRVY